MAEKTLNTRIQLKIDTWENWKNSELILKDGELGFVRIPAETGEMTTEPTVLFKVGNGEDLFKDLPWPSALAGDVHEWAKAPERPTYSAEDITGIDNYIAEYVNEQMGISVDTDTQYQIVKVDDYNYKLQSKGKLDEAWADVEGSAFVIPNDTEAIAAALKAGQDAQAAIDSYIESNNKALADEIARATEAEEANAAAAKKAQDDVDALKTFVGELPEDATAESVVAYIDEKTSGLSNDLGDRVKAIEDDYLTSTDKTELADAVATEKTRAEEIEAALRTDVDVIKGDYLKAADKTELQGNIDIEKGRIDVLVGDDANKSVRTIANEELAKQLIAEGAQEALDTLGEIAAWIQAHPGDAAAMNKAIEDLEALVGTLPEGATATTVVGYIDEVIVALKIGDYAKAEDLAGAIERIAALEANVEAWNAAEQNAKDYADELNGAMDERVAAMEEKVANWDAAEQNAKDYADELNTAMDERMTAVETDKANKADLAAIATSGNVNDLIQTEGDVLVFYCGTASTVI